MSPDKRRHRGPHPDDRLLFDVDKAERVLRRAVSELSWLLTRDYSLNSASKLVGDRYQLKSRQRLAMNRSACSDASLLRRRRHHVDAEELAGEPIIVDGFNLLLILEAALAGGVLLEGRDSCIRDMASMHGSYRQVAETVGGLLRIGGHLQRIKASHVLWVLDRPVSNSGRLKQRIELLAARHSWPWQVRLEDDADRLLIESPDVVVSSDAMILDQCDRWHNLAGGLLPSLGPLWLLRLGVV